MLSHYELELAGDLGFEPRSDGVKVRCLTAWLIPNGKGVVEAEGIEPPTLCL
jgi:hypothetical protein